MAMKRRFPRDTRGPQIRVNHRIRVPEVRVVGEGGENLGVLPTDQALQRAQRVGLDLVEVNPKAVPPVCKILDFGKYKYEEKKKLAEAKRKQTIVEVKEIKLRPKTDDHDLEVKVRASRRFLETGNKVKVTCRFRGREITHPQKAREKLDYFLTNLVDIALIEQPPTMEGRTMAIIMATKPQVMQRLQSQRAQRDRERAALGLAAQEVKEPNVQDLEEELHEKDDDDDDGDDDSGEDADEAEDDDDKAEAEG